jgi:hypothetical protein
MLNNKRPSSTNEDTYQLGKSAVIVRSYSAGKESLQDILKRLILREYERQTTRQVR